MNQFELDRLSRQRVELLTAARDLERRIDELGELIEQARQTDRGGIDYDAIRQCAGLFSFGAHPLGKLSPPELVEPYLLGLLQLAQLEGDHQTELLIFIQWILDQSGIQKRLSDLLAKSYGSDKNRLYGRLSQLSGDLASMFLLDLLIGASLGGSVGGDALDYISELASLQKLDEESVKSVSVAARCALRGKVERTEYRILDQVPRACAIYLPEQARRVKLKTPGPVLKWKWYCQTGEYVEKGQILGRDELGKGKAYAPCSGIVVRWTSDFKPRGVIGWYGDDKDRAKNWLKQLEEEEG